MASTAPASATPPSRLATAAAEFFHRLPALVAAMAVLRVAELLAGSEAGESSGDYARLGLGAFLVDAVNLLRYLPPLFLFSLPFLLLRKRRLGFWGIGLGWSVVLVLQAALVQYFITARVPLGADWSAYASADLQSTVRRGLAFNAWLVAGLTVALACLWSILAARQRQRWRASGTLVAILLASLLMLAFVPARSDFIRTRDEDSRNLQLSKLGFFLDDNVLYFIGARRPAVPVATAGEPPELKYLDPVYPFLHAEQTPDALGKFFRIDPGKPPNLVLVIVEGLGRSFSGPGARLGSFTPELDKLAAHSLYWENFLAVQGRTFAVMPSVLGSAPFGEHGLSGLGNAMPSHHTLLSVLKSQGYWLKFYSGYDSDFDNESLYLQRQGVDVLVDRFNFGTGYQISNGWGYGDAELVSRALAAERSATRQPFLTLIKTVTMHSPYVFRGQASFAARFEQRLQELGIDEDRRARYRAHQDIYTSILYADQALGRFFEQAKGNPGYENTIFVVVGDHRLPEIPMGTRIERYHVPLIIFSPLLKAPARFKSVSSHFDITPSLLAFLARNYGLHTPEQVTWLGTGLDVEPGFRNRHHFPLKQTKTNLVDYVSGPYFLNQDRLYSLADGMDIEPNYNEATQQRLQAQFATFRNANQRLVSSLALMPREPVDSRPAPTIENDPHVSVADVQVSPQVGAAPLAVEAVFLNGGGGTSRSFVPILVLTGRNGEEVSETYGASQRLLPGQRLSVPFRVDSAGLPRGEYHVTVIAVQPGTNRRIGTGRMHVPVQIGG